MGYSNLDLDILKTYVKTFHFSGVVAGSVWGKIWPEHHENIIVGSSLYDASVKVKRD